MQKNPPQLKVFISYSHKDEKFKNQLIKFLIPLQKQSSIDIWEASQLPLGSDFNKRIIKKINQVDIFLLLVSPDSIASKYINEIELKHAFKLKKAKRLIIVPIILRPCNWELLEINQFHAAPIGGKAVTLWDNLDEAFKTIVVQLEKLVFHYLQEKLNKERSKSLISSNSKALQPKKNYSLFEKDIKSKMVFGSEDKLKAKITKNKK